MKKILAISAIFIMAVFSFNYANAAAKYVGATKCKVCHMSEKSGKAYPIWEKSAHAKAYATLATQEALEIGKKMGIENPQKSDKCLVCHVTGFTADKALKDTTLTLAEGVSCEACHGPGSDYKAMSIMKDRAKAVAAGLLIPNEKTCLTCHNEKSPTYKPFKFAEMNKQIAHMIPKATPAAPTTK
jgi:hypothetical protein